MVPGLNRRKVVILITSLRSNPARAQAASQIVPGDVLVLNAGDLLPADCLIINANELYANESSLTGEPYPLRKAAGVLDEQTALAAEKGFLGRQWPPKK